MSDQLTRELANGQHAADLLNNPLFEEIWTNYRNLLVQALESTDQRDEAALLKINMTIFLLAKLKASVLDTVATGKMARIQMESRQSVGQKVRAGLTGLTI